MSSTVNAITCESCDAQTSLFLDPASRLASGWRQWKDGVWTCPKCSTDEQIAKQRDDALRKIEARAMRRVEARVLRRVLAIVQEHHDTVDDDGGSAQANIAMRITDSIKEAFHVKD